MKKKMRRNLLSRRKTILKNYMQALEKSLT